ncbi:DEP domain-containing protein 7-like [Salvelinus fontinalis]|uniref:DEP domain-containing protein 7-like n=1 Tax=Salvelinus fontinalis TaxID=8038 RepID=UPI0024869218|nr:DEP domain-containing protein 7-like [Salvelinus fontinalis]
MATVKERAAALNLSGKLCLRSPGHGMVHKPFQASPIWSSIIANLKMSVKVKRRRFHLKSHNDCFLGSDAVDVVLDHIVQSKFFEGADISRDKVVRVCQALLDCKVFETVGAKVFGKDTRQDVFQDSKGYLYRFLHTQMPSMDELEKGILSPGIQSTFCSASCRQEEQLYSHGTPLRSNQLLETVLGNLSLSPSKAHIDSPLPQTLVDEVWREETMLRLLQLVELPMLDNLLEGGEASPRRMAQRDPDLIYTSNYLDREILRAFKDSQEDDWLTAALDCLEFLPDQQVVEVSRDLPRCPDVVGVGQGQPCCSGSGTQQCKLLLYETLVKYYGQPDRSPLLANHMSDFYTGVTELLVNAKFDKALEALQLCLKLLHPRKREELRTLLSFMAMAADPLEIKLDKEVENKMVVKMAFSRAIIHSKSLAKEKVDLLVLFMLDNRHYIFKIPGSLHKLVSDKLARVVQGEQPDVTGSTFCQQVSTKAYTDCTQRTTHEALLVLLRNINEDPKHSAKERKRLLRQFYQGHPEIFVQYFGDSVSAVGV